MNLKNVFKVIVCLLLVNTGIQAQTPDERGYLVEVGDQAPDFEMTLIDGTTQKLSDLKGQVVMLQFTASWCGVCRKEMPHIEKRIWKKYKDQGIIVIGVDRDEPLEKVKAFAKQTGISYPLALDPGADIFGLFADKKSGVTRNVLIDKEGKIIFLTRLFNEEEFEALVTRIGEEVK